MVTQMTPKVTQGKHRSAKGVYKKDFCEGTKTAGCSLILQKAGELAERPAQQKPGDRPEGHYSREHNETSIGNQML